RARPVVPELPQDAAQETAPGEVDGAVVSEGLGAEPPVDGVEDQDEPEPDRRRQVRRDAGGGPEGGDEHQDAHWDQDKVRKVRGVLRVLGVRQVLRVLKVRRTRRTQRTHRTSRTYRTHRTLRTYAPNHSNQLGPFENSGPNRRERPCVAELPPPE